MVEEDGLGRGRPRLTHAMAGAVERKLETPALGLVNDVKPDGLRMRDRHRKVREDDGLLGRLRRSTRSEQRERGHLE
jgi:hypothetical protein